MKVGDKVVVQSKQGLFSRHPGIRFESTQTAVSMTAPQGASGHVLAITADGQEALIEIYWNANPRAAPGAGETWRFWVKREWFGQLLVA